MDASLSALDLAEFEPKAQAAARLLKAIANEKRLMILCLLAEAGEMRVNALAAGVGLSQSALSQHLARMRADGLVAFRRDSQNLHYRVDDPDVWRLLGTLKDIFCPPPENETAVSDSTNKDSQ